VDVRLIQKFQKKGDVMAQIEDKKQFIKNWIEKKLQGQGNPLEDLDSDVKFVIPGSEDNPIFGTFSGIEEVQKFFGLLQEKVTQTFKVIDCIAEDNQVMVLIEETLTRKDEPSKHYLNHTAWLFRLKHDRTTIKIVYVYTYDDTLVTAEALA
jgi:ketosteroid isomerase-like protein